MKTSPSPTARQQLVASLTQQMRRLERSGAKARPARRDVLLEGRSVDSSRLDSSRLLESGKETRSGSALSAASPSVTSPSAASPEPSLGKGLTSAEGLEWRTTGVGFLDRLLVEGGLPQGCLMEWFETTAGSGVDTLALWAAARARRPNELLMVIDSRGDFYPPGGAPLGLDLRTTVVIRPPKLEDVLWTLEQALRTSGVGVVICPWQRLSAQAFRRLQLAAEKGGSLGILLRPARNGGEPSFAEVRWGVQPLPSTENGARRWRVELLRARRQMTGGSIELELHDDGSRWHLVSAVASATCPVEAAGA